MKRLLCATDLLPKSEHAIDRAGMLAHEVNADLSLLHVVSPTASERILEESLQIAIARMKSRVRRPLWRAESSPSVLVRTGNPARLILDTVVEEEPDVLIIGPHRKRSAVDVLEGTIAQKVLSARRCSLLMVQRPADAGYNNVLLALDLSPASGEVVRAAESLLRNDNARTTVVHAREPQDPDGTGIEDMLRRESIDAGRYEIEITEGRPVPALERAIGYHRPDLLVLGTRGHGPVRRALIGSVANHLLNVIGCDVLVVPRGTVESARVARHKAAAPASVHSA